MSGSIQAIIADMRDKQGGVYLCPVCSGGKRGRRTLSISLREGVWLWLCHRPKCGEKGALAASGEIRRRVPATFEPKVLDWPLRFPEPGDAISQKIAGKIERPLRDFAQWHGLRVSEVHSASYAWAVRDLAGRPFGHITRDESKRILTWKGRDAPWYASFVAPVRLENDPHTLVVVEDCLSAALLAEEGVSAIAVLSDSMQMAVAQEIGRFAYARKMRIFVVPDPDNAGLQGAMRTVRRLQGAGAPHVGAWFSPQDVKDLSLLERKRMIHDMQEYAWVN